VSWADDWAWGLPLLVLTVVFHVTSFMLITRKLVPEEPPSRDKLLRFIVLVAIIALSAATLHGLEAVAWALLYMWLGALPDASDAVLYSLGAITSYGHADIFLEDGWRLLGSIEAVNGLILFGLTTAFLFAAIQKAWPGQKR
jgi:hypothetical protein